MARVSLVAVFRDGKLLLGKRRDNGKWTLPGGHLEEGESPEAGARREVREETGLAVDRLTLRDERKLGRTTIYTFNAVPTDDSKPTPEDDPDEECLFWRWVDVSDGVPKDIAENAHGPEDTDKNVLLDLFGFKKSERVYGDGEDLIKHDTPEFKSWFQGSKIVGTEGVPLRVYHGTSKDRDFSTFKIGDRGAWFTADPEEASRYANENDSQDLKLDPVSNTYKPINQASRVIPAYLNLKNPYKMTEEDSRAHMFAPNYKRHQAEHFRKLKAMGHDGVDFGDGTYVAFYPHQIKGAFNERPTEAKAFNKGELQKTQEVAGFPRLGIENRRETPIIETDQQRKLKEAQLESTIKRVIMNNPRAVAHEREGISKERYAARAAMNQGPKITRDALGAVYNPKYVEAPRNRVNTSFALGVDQRRKLHPYTVSSRKSDIATKIHEDFHQMMDRVRQRYGNEARYNLAWNIWHSVADKPYAKEFADHLNGHLGDAPIRPEENIAIVLSYLNDEGERTMYHTQKGHSSEQARVHANGIKRTLKQIQQKAAEADASWLQSKKFHPPVRVSFAPPPPAARPLPQTQPKPIPAPKPKAPKPENPNQLSLFKTACSATYETLAKMEDDEVDRMLLHPSAVERRLALKLNGVRSKHLIRALHDDDPEIQRAALRHPAVDHDTLLSLMQMPGREHLQLLALQHPGIHRDHVEALYHNHKDNADADDIIRAISHHPHLDGKLIEQMVDEGHGHGVVENLNTPTHVLEKLIEAHVADPEDLGKKALARRALQHQAAPKHLVEQAFKDGPLDVKLAVARGPHLPAALAQDVLTRGLLPGNDHEALLRQAIVQHADATPQHLQTATKDRHAVVRAYAHQRLGVFKHSRSVGEWLAKAVIPSELHHLAGATNDQARDIVDHKPDLEAHPPQHQPDVQAYRNHVIDSPEERSSPKHKMTGVAQKALYYLPSHHPTHPSAKFMVKPYHEKSDEYGRLPIKGWAEMTNQALYHASGIGDLHQRVHVSEHNMGPGHEKEPAIVIHMAPGYYSGYHSDFDESSVLPPETDHALRQMSMMDFLSDNIDRHGNNIMFNEDSKPLAIDHGLSFQYDPTTASSSPAFVDYSSALRRYGMSDENVEGWKKAFDWWHQASPQIKQEMYKRLEQIRDPGIRAHVRRNFDNRADFLDQHAEMAMMNKLPVDWYDRTVISGHRGAAVWPPQGVTPPARARRVDPNQANLFQQPPAEAREGAVPNLPDKQIQGKVQP